jgi:hypothetical protein
LVFFPPAHRFLEGGGGGGRLAATASRRKQRAWCPARADVKTIDKTKLEATSSLLLLFVSNAIFSTAFASLCNAVALLPLFSRGDLRAPSVIFLSGTEVLSLINKTVVFAGEPARKPVRPSLSLLHSCVNTLS